MEWHELPKYKKMGGCVGGGGRGRVRWGRVDVIEELKFLGKFTKKYWGVSWGVGLVGGGGGGGGGRVVGGGGGVRVDVNEELKFSENSKKRTFFFLGGGGFAGALCRVGGVRVDVNEELKFL